MNCFSNEERFQGLIEKPKDIKSSLLKDKMLLISGDFYGIQKFIFDRLSTKNASKVLRAKSAFIQIFTEYIARYICSELGATEKNIISMNAGKFEILIPEQDIKLNEIQDRIDKYFIKNFYGLSGVMISFVECKQKDFEDKKLYKKLRKKIINSIEDKKFQKFNLFKKDASDVLSYDTNVNNQTLCPICNIRKSQEEKENCSICDAFISLGKELAKDSHEEVSSSKLGIHFDDNYNPKIKLDKKIKSYVKYEKKDGIIAPINFKVLADSSCSDLETGIKSLAILKADVDNMGKFLENSDVTNSFESFDSFSKTMDNFFSLYVPKMMKENYPNTYTVFAGGDDLFLLGAWNEILDLARDIEKEFKLFVNDNKLSISFGIAIAKPTTPISYLADYTEHLLEEAKGIDGDKEVKYPKDAISLFGETVKWNSYLDKFSILEKAFRGYENMATSTLYRLLDFCNMSKRVKQGDIEATIWKSKLNYLFYRNMNIDKDEELMKILSENIEKYPKETKMFLVEFIYKRRKV